MMWMQEDSPSPNYISIVSVSMWLVLLSSIQLLLTMIIQQVEFCCFIVTFLTDVFISLKIPQALHS